MTTEQTPLAPDAIEYIWDGSDWAMTVNDPSVLTDNNALYKAYERKFSTRSEAARYAAQVRWGNRGADSTGGQTAAPSEVDAMVDLANEINKLNDMMDTVSEADLKAAGNGKGKRATSTQVYDNPQYADQLVLNVRASKQPSQFGDTQVPNRNIQEGGQSDAYTVLGPKAFAIEQQVQVVGTKTLAIADARLAARGIKQSEVDARGLQLQAEITTLVDRKKMLDSQIRGAGRPDSATLTALRETQTKIGELSARRDSPEGSYEAARRAEALAVVHEVKGTRNPVGQYGADRMVSFGTVNAPNIEAVVGDALAKALTPEIQGRIAKAGGIKVSEKPQGANFNGPKREIVVDNARLPQIFADDKYSVTRGDRMLSLSTIHEFGHATAWTIPAVAVAENAFLQRRIHGGTKGQSPREFMQTARDGLSMDGFTRRDKFSEPYMGMDYAHPLRMRGGINRGGTVGSRSHLGYPLFPNTEILSLGLEGLATSSHRMRTMDNDHLTFTLGILMGVGRVDATAMAVAKAYERRFGSRSEAGRYAAQIRWGNRGQMPESVEQPTTPVDPVEELRAEIDKLQTMMSSITGDAIDDATEDAVDTERALNLRAPLTVTMPDGQVVNITAPSTQPRTPSGKTKVVSKPEDFDDPSVADALIVVTNPKGTIETNGQGGAAVAVVGPKAIALEAQVTLVGQKAHAIVDARLAARGITKESVARSRSDAMLERHSIQREISQLQVLKFQARYGRDENNQPVTGEQQKALINSLTAQIRAKKAQDRKLQQDMDGPLNWQAVRGAETVALVQEIRGKGQLDYRGTHGSHGMAMGTVNLSGGTKREEKAVVDAVQGAFPKPMIDAINGGRNGNALEVTIRQPTIYGDGSHYNAQKHTMELSSVKDKQSYGLRSQAQVTGLVAVHEFAHAIETLIPSINVATAAFMERRQRRVMSPTGRASTIMRQTPLGVTLLAGVAEARTDKYANPYSGRWYAAGSERIFGRKGLGTRDMAGTGRYFFASTELFTTGMEGLLQTSRRMTNIDQDHLDFTLGLLLGAG